MLARVLPGTITVLLWTAFAIGSAVALKTFSTTRTILQKIGKTVGLILFVYGIALIIATLSGNTNPLGLLSFAFLQNHSISDNSKKFIPVYTLADVQHQLNLAKTQNKLTMIDFYADWRISCKEMEQFTFSNLQVQKALGSFQLLRADRDPQQCRKQTPTSPFRCHSPSHDSLLQ